MKKIIFSFLALVFCSAVFSQDFSGLSGYTFSSKEDYKAKEPQVKECEQYILNKPYDKNDGNRLIASQFLLAWMTGTPDYTFTFGDGFKFVTGGKTDLGVTELYLAASIDYVFNNPANAKDYKTVDMAAVVKIVEYCANDANVFVPNKKIKKLVEAKKNNKLEQELHF